MSNYTEVNPKNNKSKVYKNINVIKEKLFWIALGITSIILISMFNHIVFNICITKPILSETISLGAIFTTFSSAIIALISNVQSSKLNRVLTNIDILFIDILKTKKWVRWAFLKRTSKENLFNDRSLHYKLENPQIDFNVGSHNISIDIPTIEDDFYDLPCIFNLYTIKKYKKHFKTNILNNKEKSLDGTIFSDIGDCCMAYDCLLDSWKNIFIYKLNKFILFICVYSIVLSIIYSFLPII